MTPATTTASEPQKALRLEVDRVSVRFGAIVAVNDVSLGVPAGEILGLIGPNGAGKTTLFDVISGARKPTGGKVCLDGADVTRRTDMGRARHGLRRTFQRPQVFTGLSVEDNVLTALEWRPWCTGAAGDILSLPWPRSLEKKRRERTREVLRSFGLDSIRDQPVGSLPTGKIRLVELARAFIADPTLLLLDEPTSGLYPGDVANVAALVREYQRDTDCSAVVVEHDIEFVLGLCHRVIVLEAGRVIFTGTPARARVDPAVRRAYLG
jgi:branched-chain amino acid transport system ATP-binding protein